MGDFGLGLGLSAGCPPVPPSHVEDAAHKGGSESSERYPLLGVIRARAQLRTESDQKMIGDDNDGSNLSRLMT